MWVDQKRFLGQEVAKIGAENVTNQTYFLGLVRLAKVIRVARGGGIARNEDGGGTVAGAGEELVNEGRVSPPRLS